MFSVLTSLKVAIRTFVCLHDVSDKSIRGRAALRNASFCGSERQSNSGFQEVLSELLGREKLLKSSLEH